MKHYKHLFFDLDRTLWDFEKNSLMVLKAIYSKYELQKIGAPLFQEFYDTYHRINHDLWDQYRVGHITKDFLSLERFDASLRTHGINNTSLASQMSSYYVEQSPYQTQLFDGTHQLLKTLHAKYQLHLITNGFAEVQSVKLKVSDLDQYFKEIIVSEHTPWKKPRPEIFKYSLNQAGALAEESLMIGDDIRADIQGAASVGMDQIWTNFNQAESSYKPTYTVTHLLQILDILG